MSRRNAAAERIRSAGLRATRARIAVLEVLTELDGHPTTDEVARCLHDRGASVARASVFNVLDDFTWTGIATVASAGPGAARHEVANEDHDHFICRVCGAIRDVPRTRTLDPLSLDADVGRIEEAHVIYRGPCAACLAAEAP